jgi:hypothetical protein
MRMRSNMKKCTKCNENKLEIGHLKDNPEICFNAGKYLIEFEE